jgi:DNA primase
MISSYSAGIRNVVAIKGSVLTEDHIRLIGRFCQEIVMCLDSDFAGDEAAKRGAIMAINLGFDVKVAHLEKFKDPDEAARNDPEEFRKTIDQAVSLWDFLINQILKYDIGTGIGRSQVSKEIVPLLKQFL